MGFYERDGKVHFTCGWGPGFIYLMRGSTDRRHGRYKLGMSVDPQGRARSMGLTLMNTVEVPNMRRAEKAAQWMFSHRDDAGEGRRRKVNTMNRLTRIILRWIQRRCDHVEMKADLCEGDWGNSTVGWCETCGAVRVNGGDLRLPEPTWHPFSVFEASPSDAAVKRRLAAAGIDMRPAYARLHKMVEERRQKQSPTPPAGGAGGEVGT